MSHSPSRHPAVDSAVDLATLVGSTFGFVLLWRLFGSAVDCGVWFTALFTGATLVILGQYLRRKRAVDLAARGTRTGATPG